MKGGNLMEIAIIDDNRLNAILLECSLKNKYSVTNYYEAVDVKELISLIPDVILLDLVMPNKSGYDLLREIKNRREFDNTKVFVVSAFKEVLAKIKAFELGANEYFEKPVNIPRLKKMLEKINKNIH